MNLLFIGNRYLPFRHEGDKNFWLVLTKLLVKQNNDIILASFNNDFSGKYRSSVKNNLYNLSTVPFPTPNSKFKNSNLKHSNNYGSKSLTVLKNLVKIRKIAQKNRTQLIHFIDNYGPIATLLNKSTKLPSSIFVPTYDPRHKLYDTMLKTSLISFSTILTTTYAFKKKLINIGIDEKKINVVRWGVDVQKLKPDSEKKKDTRLKLGIPLESKIVLWSGFLQQTSYKDFIYAIKIAYETLKHTKKCVFIFAFKDVHFDVEYLNYRKKDILILSISSNKEFLNLINSSDIFLSPIMSTKSIVAPPLTWIESMSYSVPVLTTRISGSDELISEGKTGYFFSSINEASQKIRFIIENNDVFQKTSRNARNFVIERLNINLISNKYQAIWKKIIEERK